MFMSRQKLTVSSTAAAFPLRALVCFYMESALDRAEVGTVMRLDKLSAFDTIDLGIMLAVPDRRFEMYNAFLEWSFADCSFEYCCACT
jgi:hypothetical protein